MALPASRILLLVGAFALMGVPEASADCAIVKGEIVCNPPKPKPGSTLRVTDILTVTAPANLGTDDAMKTLLMGQDAPSGTIATPGDAERFRKSLEAINRQIEADRIAVETEHKAGKLAPEDYGKFHELYRNAIGNYRDGIEQYRTLLKNAAPK